MKQKHPRTEAQLYADKYLRTGYPSMGDEAKQARFTVMLSAREKAIFSERAKAEGLALGAWLLSHEGMN